MRPVIQRDGVVLWKTVLQLRFFAAQSIRVVDRQLTGMLLYESAEDCRCELQFLILPVNRRGPVA